MQSFSDREKLEVVERMIEQWRPTARGERLSDGRDVYLILKAIASDYRGRQPGRAGAIGEELERIIELAVIYKDDNGRYTHGRMTRIAQFVIGARATIRQALDKFEGESKT
jgi:hypothetical protein